MSGSKEGVSEILKGLFEKKMLASAFFGFIPFVIINLITLPLMVYKDQEVSGWDIVGPVPLTTYVFSVLVGYLILIKQHLDKTINKEGIREIAADSLKSAIKEKDIFITGVHRGGNASGAALIADANLIPSGGKSHPDGLLVLRNSATVEEYGQHCLTLLGTAIKQGKNPKIYSMSDMGLDKTFWYYSGDKTAIKAGAKYVTDWLGEVNGYHNNGNIDIKRVQVLTKGRFEFMQEFIAYQNSLANGDSGNVEMKEKVLKYVRPAIKSLFPNDDDGLMRALSRGFEYYCKSYALMNECDLQAILAGTTGSNVWGIYLRESLVENSAPVKLKQVVPAEFVLVDSKVLVRYQEDSCLLETLMGKIVTPFNNGFKNNVWGTEKSLSPLFFGMGNYDASCSQGTFAS